MPVNTSAIRVGVVGAGYFGRHHCRILSELEEARLTAISDTDGERAREVAGQLETGGVSPEIFSNYEPMLSSVDAVVIAAPTEVHKDIALGCLRAGKHVFIEKPITADIRGADELISTSAGSGLVVQVGHIERFNPAFVSLSQLVKAPTHVETERFSPLLQRALDTDVTIDLMIHDIDIVLTLMGAAPIELKAVGASVVSDKIDVARAWLSFEGGATAILSAGRLSDDRIRILKVCQADALYHVDYQSRILTKYTRNGGSLKSEKIKNETIPAENVNPLKEELRDFLLCTMHGQRPQVTAIDGKNALKLALDIGNLIRENKNYKSVMI